MSQQEHPEEYAKKHGLEIILPQPCQLQVDIDSHTLPEHFEHCLKIIGQENPVLCVGFTTSKSGNIHAYVELTNEFSDHERIAMQAILGSDPVREALTLQNLSDPDNKRPQFLFELKDAVRRRKP